MVSVTVGLVGGLVGSVAMSAAARLAGDGPWPSAVVWAMYLGDGHPDHYAAQGLVVHLGYGTLAGGGFAALVGGLPTFGAAVGASVAWAAVLALVAVVGWLHVLAGADLDLVAVGRVAGLHLVYGAVLGVVAYGLPGV